jgi:hypothetical protein
MTSRIESKASSLAVLVIALTAVIPYILVSALMSGVCGPLVATCGKASTQAVTWDWPFSARPGFDPSSVHVTRWTQWHCARLFSQYCCFPCQHHSTNAPHSHPTILFLQGQVGGAWNLPKYCFWRHRHSPPPACTHSLTCVTKLPPEATHAADLKQGNSVHKCYTPGLPLVEISTESSRHCVHSSCFHMQFVVIISGTFYTWRKMGRPEDQKGPHTKFGQNRSNGKAEVVPAHATQVYRSTAPLIRNHGAKWR